MERLTQQLLNDLYKSISSDSNLDPSDPDLKYVFLAANIFDLTTYSDGLDRAIVNEILEILKDVYDRVAVAKIDESDEYHLKFVRVLNTRSLLDWVEWGTSVRSCWLIPEKVDLYRAIVEFLETP